MLPDQVKMESSSAGFKISEEVEHKVHFTTYEGNTATFPITNKFEPSVSYYLAREKQTIFFTSFLVLMGLFSSIYILTVGGIAIAALAALDHILNR